MAELTYTLGEHPQIKELLSVLEQKTFKSKRKKCRPWWAIWTVWRGSWLR